MEKKKLNKMVDDVLEFEAMEGVVACGENQEAGLKEPEVHSRKQEHLYMVHEKQFRSIFPEETWLRILNKLDREDQENCVNASPYFWELLQKQRTLLLFPKAIDIMALIFEQNYDVCKVSTAERDGDGSTSVESVTIVGNMSHSLHVDKWKKMVLRCRLVCSTWNTAIVNCYQKPLMTGIPEFVDEIDARSKLINLGIINWTKLGDFDQIQHSGVGVPPKYPIPGRYLVIRIGMTTPEYVSNLTEIIKTIGQEIWYLEVMIGNQHGSPACHNLHIFRKLRGYLRLVPNLKFLQIQSRHPIPHLSSISGKHPDIIVCSPLPTFKKLEILSLKNLGAQIGSELLRKNSHVTYLKIGKMDFDPDLENSLEMPNLQGLSVLDTPSGEKVLENYGPIWKNVKKLCFGVNYVRKCYPGCKIVRPTVGIGAPEAFAILQNNWAETLTDVRLNHVFGLDENTVMEQSKALRLNLPGLRRLTLRDFPCVFLDFALPLRNCLEHLVFQFHVSMTRPLSEEYQQRVESEQYVQLTGFEDKMHLSNIWEIFGKLKTVKIGNVFDLGRSFTLFTREKEKFEYSKKREL